MEPEEERRRRRFLEEVNRSYELLREDAPTRGEMRAEQELWEASLMDGLSSDKGWVGEGKRSSEP